VLFLPFLLEFQTRLADVISFRQNKKKTHQQHKGKVNKWFPLNVNKSMMANN